MTFIVKVLHRLVWTGLSYRPYNWNLHAQHANDSASTANIPYTGVRLTDSVIKMRENVIFMYKCICVRLHLSTGTCLHRRACVTDVKTPSAREQRPYLRAAIPCCWQTRRWRRGSSGASCKTRLMFPWYHSSGINRAVQLHSPLLCHLNERDITETLCVLPFYRGSKWPAARTSALHFLPGLIYHILFSLIFLQGCNFSWERTCVAPHCTALF